MSIEFEHLISEHSGRIKAIAKRYAQSDSAVDDLYQEILEQLWRSFATFKGQAKVETWIYRVGFNTAMSGLRKVTRQRRGESQLLSMHSPQGESGGFCQSDILEDFLRSISDVDASLLMMYLDGLSSNQMADVLGMKANAASVRISRLKQAFNERYINQEVTV